MFLVGPCSWTTLGTRPSEDTSSPVYRPPFPHSRSSSECEWQRLRQFSPSLNLLFLKGCLKGIVRPKGRKRREMLPPSGKHAKVKPQRPGISYLFSNSPGCGDALLCVLGITNTLYARCNCRREEETWVSFIIDSPSRPSFKDRKNP